MSKIIIKQKINDLIENVEKITTYVPNGNQKYDQWYLKISRFFETHGLERYLTPLANSQFKDNMIQQSFDQVYNSTAEQNKYNKAVKDAVAILRAALDDVNEWANTPYDDAYEKIQSFMKDRNELEVECLMFQRYRVNEKFERFKLKFTEFLKRIYGSESDEYLRFEKINFLYSGSRGMDGVQVPLDNKTYEDGLISTRILIENIKENLLTYGLKSNQFDIITTNTERISSNTVIVNIGTKSPIDIFVVHGHDDHALSQVSAVLLRLKLNPIVLKDEASGSDTIIEKIERLSSTVGFGIVLYTDCDIGGKTINTLKSRARQNVIFEHGYLMAKIGRKNTMALVKGDIEKPSDINGLVYAPMDEHGAWRYKIVDELKHCGYNVDKNDI